MCECEHLLTSTLSSNRSLKLNIIFSLLPSTCMGEYPLIRHKESGAFCLMQELHWYVKYGFNRLLTISHVRSLKYTTCWRILSYGNGCQVCWLKLLQGKREKLKSCKIHGQEEIRWPCFFSHGILFYPEDGRSRLVQNFSKLLTDFRVSYYRIQCSS